MSYFLPPPVAEPPEPKSGQQAACPARTSGSSKSITKREDKSRGPRSSSLGDWWRNMLPSQKAERGGTVREQPSQGADAIPKKPYRRATDGQRSRRSETRESDRYTGWNLAKDISENNDDALPSLSDRRAVSHAAGASLHASDISEISDRKWSWVPQVQLPENLAVKGLATRDRKVSWQDTALDDEPQISADYIADRRLSTAQRAIEAKKEARRQRRSLKESGDYLGVQGINPETGLLNVLTPSNSDNSTESPDFNQKIGQLKRVLKDSRTHHKNVHLPGHTDREAKRLYLKREKEKRDRDEKRKQELAARQNLGPRWKRHSKQWSSAQEPALSPIAQSVRSGTTGSRRPSVTFNRMSREGQLVDLASPEQLVDTEKKLPSPPNQQTSGGTSKSGTVVHTHKPSITSTSTSSAALELFENGISFDQGAQSSRAKETKKAPFPLSGLSTSDTPRPVFSDEEDGHDQHPRPEDVLSTQAAQSSDITARDSFLDLPALGGPLSQGRGSGSIPRPLSTTNLLKVEKNSIPRRSISLFPKKHRSTHWLSRVSPPTESPESSLIPSSKTSATLTGTPTRTDSTGDQVSPLLEGSPLLRLSPTHLLQRMRKKRMQRAGTLPPGNEPTLPLTALESLTNLNQVQQASGLATMDGIPTSEEKVLPQQENRAEHARVTPVAIQEDMDYLRKNIAKVDELNWMNDRKVSDLLQKDNAWIEDTIRDITDKGDLAMDKPASTPTITTTGSVPPMSGSCQSKKRSGVKTKTSRCAPQMTGFSKPTRPESKISPQNHRQSSLLRLTPEGQIVPIDIMSTVDLGQRHVQEAEDRFRNISTSTSAQTAKKENAAAPAIDVQTPPQQKKTQSQELGEARVQAHPVSLPANKPHTPGVLSGQIGNSQHKPVRQHLRCSPEQLLQDLIQAVPGAYPFRPEGEEDTDDPFGDMKMSQAFHQLRDLGTANGNIWDAIKEFVFVARCHVEVAVRLYWRIAGPVFDSKSQYWVRNKSGNATLLDGVAFVLAVPGALLGLLVFV